MDVFTQIVDATTIAIRKLSNPGGRAMFNNSSTPVATTKQAAERETEQSWVGFLCKECGAPLAVHRSNNGSRPGENSLRGWRITCISCGVPAFYELGSAMVRIAAT